MGFIITITAGLVVWIVLWALGVKGFDAFLLAAVIILGGRVAEDPLRLSARPSQLALTCSRAGWAWSLSPPCCLGWSAAGAWRCRTSRKPPAAS